MTAISPISGNQWTDLYDTSLTATERTAYLDQLSDVDDFLTWAGKQTGAVSINDYRTHLENEWKKAWVTARTTEQLRAASGGYLTQSQTGYAQYGSLAEAKAALNQIDLRPVPFSSTATQTKTNYNRFAIASYYDSASNSTKWVMRANGVAYASATSSNLVYSDLYATNSNFEALLATISTNTDYQTTSTLYWTNYSESLQAGGTSATNNQRIVIFANLNTTPPTAPAAPNTLLGTLSTTFAGQNGTKTVAEWKAWLATNADYAKTKSKLSVGDGGGIQYVNGVVYVNGAATSILDLMFVVRVNQLFVIDNKTVNFLKEIQAKNLRIKIANELSTALSAKSPTSTDGTVTITEIFKVLDPLLDKYNLVTRSSPTVTNADGTKSYAAATNVDALKEYLSSSYTKILNGLAAQSGSLKQADINVMTTELKSYTSNLESDNQLLQTYLEQYNNKKSEVLDGLSNYVKSYVQGQQSVARNIGSV